jgi:hypothetical protein
MAEDRFPAVESDFSFLRNVQTGSGAHPVSYQIGNSIPGGKAPGSEADKSPPSSVAVNNIGAIPPLPHTFSSRDV